MSQRKLIVHEDAKSPVAEAFRTLRTNIQFAKADSEIKTIMFTSSGPGEGKSIISANMAVALAQSGKRVILMDCDLRKPVQHLIFRKNNRGVTNILAEGLPVETFIQETEIPGLRVVTSGAVPPNPSELLGAAKMSEIINELKTKIDYLIIDAPPVVAVTDACVLASKVDGVLLIVDSGVIRPEMAQKAKDSLLRAKGHILGIILNKVELDEEHAYYYYYYDNQNTKSER